MNMLRREVVEMDGLRGVAILAVLIVHTIPYYLPGGQHLPDFIGELGVPLFFAVSGFCICYSLFFRYVQGKKSQVDDFARRRFRRIYPPYILAVFIFLIKVVAIEALARHPLPLEEIGRMIFFNVTLTQVFMADTTPVNPAFWSLCVEFQFYIAVGILIWLGHAAGRKGTLLGLIAILSFLFGFHLLKLTGVIIIDARAWFMALPRYAPHFLFGAALAWQHVRLGTAGGVRRRDDLALMTSGIMLVWLAPYGILIACLLVLAANHDRWTWLSAASRWLRAAPLRFLGERSYSIYLIHGLGIAFMSRYGAARMEHSPALGIGVLIASWGVALSLGLIYFHLVERHFLRSVGATGKV